MGWQPSCVLLRGLVILTFGFHWFVLATLPSNAKFYTIHWNSSNPIFRIDNTDNIIDVNRNNVKFEYDQVNLICPVYTPGTRDEDMEKYIIYNVSKDEYETCRITNPNPRIIAVCDKPYKLMYFTITFRPFTPQPGGLEFLPAIYFHRIGHDYYFISTSTSDDLHRRIGGSLGPSANASNVTAYYCYIETNMVVGNITENNVIEYHDDYEYRISSNYYEKNLKLVKSEELTLGGATPSAKVNLIVICVVSTLVFAMR
ncbi:hypothetical protein NQ318_008383 [Aromia moschata]|uniref:Ephrin RBD domain-containing protein n=1 Tax=Aromia moschata TaxID=1265417 RepID=A0AAV8YHT7_9CUCU|nr:hypothetical protein NQ318_008383 [Aromia moschata]